MSSTTIGTAVAAAFAVDFLSIHAALMPPETLALNSILTPLNPVKPVLISLSPDIPTAKSLSLSHSSPSFPSDLRAQQTALFLMNRAFDEHHTTTVRRIRRKSPPLWFRVHGSYNAVSDVSIANMLKSTDHNSSYPCYLVISNVDAGSSRGKLEKVKDLLDMFSDIPRILVVAPEDPLTFFATRLHVRVTAGLHLGPGSRRVIPL